jgi:signal transduction histidine kinase
MSSETVIPILNQDRRIAQALVEIGAAVDSAMDLAEILQRLCDVSARVMGTQTCSIYLCDEADPAMLVLRASHGLSMAEQLGQRGFRVGEGLPGWSAEHELTLAVADQRQDPRWARLDDTASEDHLRAYLCTPLRIRGRVVGIISFRRKVRHEWTPEETTFLEFVSKQVAFVLDRAHLHEAKMEAERLAAISLSLSEVAHYIKNVLQNMAGGAYFVDVGLKRGDPEMVERGWVLHKRSTEKIRTLIENMLAYTREKRIELREDDLNALVAELAASFEEAAYLRKVRFRVQLADTVPPLRLDREAMQDAVLNLLTNALDATDTEGGGEIALATRLDLSRRAVCLTVEDNGCGIPDDARSKLFNLFFTTKGRKGTGIGLAVTRKIVLEHGGTIDYETELGHGTKFTITLPLP